MAKVYRDELEEKRIQEEEARLAREAAEAEVGSVGEVSNS